jgi:hypothetical protein
MVDQSHSASTAAHSTDILPWADPYIMQLFAEAELLEPGDDSKPSPRRNRVELPSGQKATGEAVFSNDSWTIRPLRRSAVPRTRRTGSEHLLARC